MTKQDLTGRRFGRLIVESFDGYKTYTSVLPDGRISVRNRPMWKCKCDCGKTVRVFGGSLLSGGTRSCGCLRREKARSAVNNMDKNSPRHRGGDLLTTGDYMRRARESANMTQEKLSSKAGIARGTLARLERYDRQGSIYTISCLADALGVSIDEYIGRVVPERIS